MEEKDIKAFVESLNKEKEEFNKKFRNINEKLDSIDRKFEQFDSKMDKLETRCKGIEDAFEQLGDFSEIMGDIDIYLSQIETKLNQYRTLCLSGRKIQNGEIFILKIQLQKVKPIVNWENNELLNTKYKEIEERFEEIEEIVNNVVQ